MTGAILVVIVFLASGPPAAKEIHFESMADCKKAIALIGAVAAGPIALACKPTSPAGLS